MVGSKQNAAAGYVQRLAFAGILAAALVQNAVPDFALDREPIRVPPLALMFLLEAHATYLARRVSRFRLGLTIDCAAYFEHSTRASQGWYHLPRKLQLTLFSAARG